MNSKPKYKKHRTPESLWRQYLSPVMKEIKTDDVREFMYGDMDYASILKHINKAGFWGFYEMPAKTIHYWHDGTAGLSTTIGFFAHELQHHAEHCWKYDRRNNIEAEEMRADQACEVAREAYRIAYRVLKVGQLIRKGNETHIQTRAGNYCT